MSVRPGRRMWLPTYQQSLLEPYSLCTAFCIRNCPPPTIHHSWSWPYARHKHGAMKNVLEQMTRTRHGAMQDFYRTCLTQEINMYLTQHNVVCSFCLALTHCKGRYAIPTLVRRP